MKVNIKGTSYLVKFVDKIEEDGESVVVGQCYKEDKKILILKGERVNSTAETIVHELLHAFFYECGLVSESSNEDAIRWIERNYFDIFKAFLKIFNSMFKDKQLKIEVLYE